jgi:hypothetical protein
MNAMSDSEQRRCPTCGAAAADIVVSLVLSTVMFVLVYLSVLLF